MFFFIFVLQIYKIWYNNNSRRIEEIGRCFFMGKSVYKIIRFILMLPINIIKYFCLGLYFVSSVLIEMMLYIIYFASFLVYKTVKYFVLFFTFPILIFNICKRLFNEIKKPKVKTSKIKSIQPIVLADVEEEFIEPILIEEDNIEDIPVLEIEENEMLMDEIPIVLEDPDFVEEENTIENAVENFDMAEIDISDDEVIPSVEIENFAETIVDEKPKKVKVARKKINVFKYLLLGSEVVSYPVYKFFKYIYLGVVFSSSGLYKGFKYLLSGIKHMLNLINKAFIFISFFVYKIFNYS